MAAAGVIFSTVCSPTPPASSKIHSLSPPVSSSRPNISFSARISSSTSLFGSINRGDGDWMHYRRRGREIYASQRGYTKVQDRPSARKKEKGKELEPNVKICIEDHLPNDPQIQDIAEMLRLNASIAMKLALDGLKDSDYKTRDPSVYNVGQYENVELSILLCNDDFIRELNKDRRNADYATDVLSMSQHLPELKLPMVTVPTMIYVEK